MSDKRPGPNRTQVSNDCPGLSLNVEEIETLFTALDQSGSFDAPTGALSFAFITKEEITRIHGQYMDDPTPTDVITFPGDPEHALAGDICVCPQVAQDYAKAHQHDFSEELTLYLIHGYLHLCGFDDKEDSDRQAMRDAEKTALSLAKKHHLIPHFEYG